MRGRLCVLIGIGLCIAGGAITTAAGEVQLRFDTQTPYLTGIGPSSVAIGDLNNDDYRDIVVANRGSNDVSVLLGNGDGSFAAQTRYPVALGPSSVAIGDFDGNGWQDLAVANYYCPGGVSVLLGNGDGSFSAPTHFPVCYNAESVAIGDFDDDGRQDLAVATFYFVWVLLGNGDGSFAEATRFAAGHCPHDVNIGDFDGDGRQDLAVANYWSDNISVLFGNGDGSFDPPTDYATGDHPESIAIGDFDGNGLEDLAVATLDGVWVQLGNGDGSFAAPTQHSAGSCPHAVDVGDLDSDGRQDIAVANSGMPPVYDGDSVSVLLGNGNGGFAGHDDFLSSSGPWSVAIGDLNSDGQQDLAVANHTTNKVSILLNRSYVAVQIDIVRSRLNPYGRGVLPVVLFGTAEFDVADVDVTTLRFGLNEIPTRHDLTDSFDYNEHLEDVNLDGYMDLMLHFETQETGIGCGDTEATLNGSLLYGMLFEGTDTFETVGCNSNRPHRGMTDRGFERMQREQTPTNTEEQQHPGDLVEEQRVD